ncbi:hypothetical protein AB0H42_04300 [Nocardia sp. NPDC050799]|uniref:hypothetical protein n=1 Tax=Nocardia sp. NPDC050799 TaxID=3154842 RepID=UPI0033D31ADE
MNLTPLEPGPGPCTELCTRTTELGGTVPAELRRLLDTHAAVRAWQPAATADHLARAITDGSFTAKNAGEYLDTELARPTTEPREIRGKAETIILRTFATAVRNGAGDAIVESVRPVFDKAKAGVVDASAWITPSTTAEQVIEFGPDALQAWYDLGHHHRTLEQVNGLVALFLDAFRLVARQPFMRHGSAPRAAFYVRDETVNLDSAAEALAPENNTGRGGRWLRLLTASDLTLNTPTRAAEIIAAQQAEYERLQREEYDASHPAYESA